MRFYEKNFIRVKDVDKDRTDEDHLRLKDGRSFSCDRHKFYFLDDDDLSRIYNRGKHCDDYIEVDDGEYKHWKLDDVYFPDDDDDEGVGFKAQESTRTWPVIYDFSDKYVSDKYVSSITITGSIKLPETKGGIKMAEQNLIQSMMSMKMLKGLMDGKKDIDLGKMYLMQVMTEGKGIQIDQVMKSKILSKFKLDGDKDDMSIEQLMLLQMLDKGNLDIPTLIAMKMLGSMFNDEEKKE